MGLDVHRDGHTRPTTRFPNGDQYKWWIIICVRWHYCVLTRTSIENNFGRSWDFYYFSLPNDKKVMYFLYASVFPIKPSRLCTYTMISSQYNNQLMEEYPRPPVPRPNLGYNFVIVYIFLIWAPGMDIHNINLLNQFNVFFRSWNLHSPHPPMWYQ